MINVREEGVKLEPLVLSVRNSENAITFQFIFHGSWRSLPKRIITKLRKGKRSLDLEKWYKVHAESSETKPQAFLDLKDTDNR